jgi:hypothetical protein
MDDFKQAIYNLYNIIMIILYRLTWYSYGDFSELRERKSNKLVIIVIQILLQTRPISMNCLVYGVLQAHTSKISCPTIKLVFLQV